MKTKLFLLILAIIVGISTASAESGTCGENLTWDLTDGVLTIIGTGEMKDYKNSSSVPWYLFRESIKTVIINDGVTSIGDDAFYHCRGLTSVTIPNSVTSIGDYAFENCSSLTSVTIPNSVTSIGYSAFEYCSSLTSIAIPNSVTSIDGGTFRNCSSLISVTIPNGVTSIGGDAFLNCSSLTSITIPNSVTSIGEIAFNGCSSLNGVYITDLAAWCNVLFSYGANPLSYAHNLYLNDTLVTDLTIPNSVTSIGSEVFSGCSSLTSVTIPNNVTSIGYSAFSGCSSLKGVFITDLTAWCNILFSYGANPLSYAHNLYLNGNLVTELTIPNCVKSIGYSTFSNCSSLTSVTIPNSVTSIGSVAFSDCSSLTSVTIPNSVTSIGNDAFSGIDSIYYYGQATGSPWGAKNVYEYYVDGIFKYQDPTKKVLVGVISTDITEVIIPDGIYCIDDKAFYNCTSLTNVIIPESVTSIGNETFAYCYSLMNVVIPESVTNIGSNAFYGISNIIYKGDATGSPWGARYRNGFADGYFVYRDEKKTDIVKFIQDFGRWNIEIPNGVITISDYAFSNSGELQSVKIPNTVTSIGEGAFRNCGLGSIIIPEGVTEIKDYTFEGCGLSSVVIPESVTSIGYRAFNGCNNLISVIIPASVRYIRNYAFYNGGRMKNITLLGCNASIGSAFDNPSYSSTSCYPENIYVPFDCFDKYHQNKSYGQYVKLNGLNYVDETTPTSAKIKFNKVADEIEIVSCKVKDGELFEGNTLEFIGLEPNSEYTDVPITITSNEGSSATLTISFTTSALELTTQPAKPVSESIAILLAETNMADIETSCGFEWRRYDAPEEMPSNTVWCPVANGLMAGRLKNLKDDAYYKYRAFYKSGAGNMYYGDWLAFGTQDVAVEFDPILYTYEATDVRKTQARLRGYALAGSEDFTEQGFEYWIEGRANEGTNGSAKLPQAHKLASNASADDLYVHHTVTASGISMSVSLTNLDEGTVYHYRSYAKIGDKVLYGSEMSFTTQGEYRYTVTFVDYDGTVIDTRETTYGNSVEAPDAPLHEGLEFIAWDTDFTSVTDDIIVKAIYADVVTGIAEQEGQAISIVRKVFDPQTHTIYVLMPDGRIYNLLGGKIR